jgi:hypothetical protein
MCLYSSTRYGCHTACAAKLRDKKRFVCLSVPRAKPVRGRSARSQGASIQGRGRSLCRAVAQSVQGSAGTRGLVVLAHLSFVEDLDDGLEIDGRMVGQLIEPLRHGDQGGSRACIRADASYGKTVGRGQAELFGSIRHVRTLRCANSTRPNWFRLVQSCARVSPRAA